MTPAPPTPMPGTPGASQPSSPGVPPATSGASPGQAFVPLTDFPVGAAFEVTAVAATPEGFVAVGFGGLAGEDYYGRRQGMVWRSPDGVSWTLSVDPALEFVSPLRVVSLDDSVYLFGQVSSCPRIIDDVCDETPDAGNAVWRSTAGGPWERLPQLSQMQLGLLDDVVAGQGRLAAFGSAGNELETTTLWLSSDGASWIETTSLGGLDPVSAMAIGAQQYVAFGTRYVTEIEDIQLTAAYSSDGLQFTPAQVPSLTGAAVEGAVAGPGGFVGVGYSASEATELTAFAVRSADGVTWTAGASSDGSFAGSGLLEVHGLPGGGYVGVGFTPRDDDFTIQDGHAWLSADGLTWGRHASLGASFTQFGGSAMGSSGLVVFTAQQDELDDESVSSIISGWFAPTSALAP